LPELADSGKRLEKSPRERDTQTQTEFRLQKKHRRFFNKYKRKRQEKSLIENGTTKRRREQSSSPRCGVQS
jgi:hypothetical protein